MQKRIRGMLAAILALALPIASSAQVVTVQRATLFKNYDVTTAGYTYATFSSDPTINYSPLDSTGMPIGKPTAIKTSGSNTTVTAVTASSAPFLYPNVGDLAICTLPFTANNLYQVAAAGEGAGQRVERLIATNADNDTITVDTAWDLGTSLNCTWKRFVSGTGATSGWIPVRGYKGLNFVATVTTINATSLDFEVSCKLEGGDPNQVFTKNFTSATYPAGQTSIAIAGEYAAYDYCRAGWKINTDTGVQSVQTIVEVTR